VPGGAGLGGEPVRADQVGQQGAGLIRGEHVEDEAVRAVAGDQAAHVVPAGDQHGAATPAGQQRPDLLGVAGVVQDDEHPPVRQQAAVDGAGPVGVGGYLFGRHTERG
jgi:hypothetical protein